MNEVDVSINVKGEARNIMNSNNLIRSIFFCSAESPATFETPRRDSIPSPRSSFSTPIASTSYQDQNLDVLSTVSSKNSKAPSHGHSLDSFLSSYTSEDNCSFEELIESADKKLRQKFSVLFDAEEETALAIAQSLSLPSIEDQFKPICGPKTVI